MKILLIQNYAVLRCYTLESREKLKKKKSHDGFGFAESFLLEEGNTVLAGGDMNVFWPRERIPVIDSPAGNVI